MKRTAPKFTVGQKVIFINEYGVNWGEKTITEHEWDEVRGNTYLYAPTETPWFMTSERNLHALTDTDQILAATRVYVGSECRCYLPPKITKEATT
jgi:hypothetical protein